MAKRRRKPRASISGSEALRRLKAMVASIERDVQIALAAEACLEEANDIVMAKQDQPSEFAAAYNAIAQSLQLNLALSLARMFDPGSKRFAPNRRDIASIPLIIRLLKQKRCRKALVTKARDWTFAPWAEKNAKDCEAAIDGAIKTFRLLVSSAEGVAATRRLRRLRDSRLAHSMMDPEQGVLPTFNQLFALMDAAREIADQSRLAIIGGSPQLKEIEEAERLQARRFWTRALAEP